MVAETRAHHGERYSRLLFENAPPGIANNDNATDFALSSFFSRGHHHFAQRNLRAHYRVRRQWKIKLLERFLTPLLSMGNNSDIAANRTVVPFVVALGGPSTAAGHGNY